MEPEINKNGRGWLIVLKVVAVLFTVFVIYYAIMSVLAPGRQVSLINEQYGIKTPESDGKVTDYSQDSAFVMLNRERAWRKARIAMAETDSISLAIDLSDSTAVIEISGVALRTSRISSYKLSSVFRKADQPAVCSMLSGPFSISGNISTIVKEPLVHKIAPKDTSEYKPDMVPDTAKIDAVNYMLEMENGYRFYFYQDGRKDGKTDFSGTIFDLKRRLRDASDILGSIIRFRVPEYHPYIRITLPQVDARMIYRALPEKGQIALKL
ncbi:MAG: hypothetical protein U0X39_07550 [Bacteroidales bacterium]